MEGYSLLTGDIEQPLGSWFVPVNHRKAHSGCISCTYLILSTLQPRGEATFGRIVARWTVKEIK